MTELAARTGLGRHPADAAAAIALRRYRLGRLALYGALTFAAFLYLFPALVVLSNSFRSGMDVRLNGIIAFPERLTLDNFISVWTRACVSGMCRGIAPNFWNSLVISVPATIIATVLGFLNGYVLSKWRFPGDAWVFGLIMLGIFMPAQTALLPWAWIIGQLGLSNNVVGLILIHSVQGLSFATLFSRNFFVGIPDEIVKAARVDGAGFWRILSRIMLPLAGPMIVVTIIWQFTSIWNEYLYGMVFTRGDQQPVTAALMGVRAGGSSAAVLIAALPPLLIYFLGGRFFVRGLTMGAVK
jgi:glucose/mannose transport system permease protein